MHGEPEPILDPYRTLGLEPEASMAEVKRAYRLLAKAFHPDSAGEAALPRFLAIHEAYELLKTGRVGARARAARAAPAAPAEPWRADPARARAARERARTGRNSSAGATGSTRPGGARGSRAGASGTTGASGTAGGSRTAGSTGGAGATGATGASGNERSGGERSGSRGSTGTRGSGRRRDVRKATMGSTSYDDARDHGDATWSGASWYGPSTGEYWIVNPREYADPRKHGPDYQSRARRPADGAAEEAITPVGAASSTEAASEIGTDPLGATDRGAAAEQARESGQARASGRARASSATSQARADRAARQRRWAAEAAASERAKRVDERLGHSGASGPRPGEAAPAAVRVEAFGAASRAWLGGPADDPIRRLGLALVAWPPLGLAAAAAIGDVTGCNVYSADCGGSEPLLPWLAQAAILGLLLLLPPITRLLAGGAIAVLLALVPITAFIIAVGGSGAPQAGFVMTLFLGAAWLAGVAWSARTFWRGRGAAAGVGAGT